MRLGLAFGLFALAATSFGANIVLNGDFATGDFTSWTSQNWDVASGGTSPTTFFAETGCVNDPCINGSSDQQAFVLQGLVTNPGDTYTLSFSYNPQTDSPSPTGPAELLVQFDGNTAIDLVAVLGPGPSQTVSPGGYNTYTITGLTASTSSTTLEFLGRQDPAGLGLTSISVVDTTSSAPEPASYLMAAAGFLVFGISKLRARA
jgi:hypothetical protein